MDARQLTVFTANVQAQMQLVTSGSFAWVAGRRVATRRCSTFGECGNQPGRLEDRSNGYLSQGEDIRSCVPAGVT